jgi:lysophospholipase L1-like esterase
MRCCFVLILWLFSACQKEIPTADAPLVFPPQGSSTSINTFLALGDSYTMGEGVYEPERFVAQTVQVLSQEGIVVLPPKYISGNGWTTGHLRLGIEYEKPERHNIVTLLIGVNDQNLGSDLQKYREGFEVLLNKAIELAYGQNSHVFVLSIPDYSVAPRLQYTDTASIRMEIDLFNMVNRSVTELYGCKYLDITELTREGRYDRSLICSDGLHPSGKEYARWAKLLAPMISKVIK